MHSFFNRLTNCLVSHCTAVLLASLAWSNLAFCGETNQPNSGVILRVVSVARGERWPIPPYWSWLSFAPKEPARYEVVVVKINCVSQDWQGIPTEASLIDTNGAVYRADANGMSKEVNLPDHVLWWVYAAVPKGIPLKALSFGDRTLAINETAANAAERAIHDASQTGDLQKAKRLLTDNPALVFTEDHEGHWPLHIAAMYGHADIAELLLTNRAVVNATDTFTNTPLHYAVIKGFKEVAELLRKNGGHE